MAEQRPPAAALLPFWTASVRVFVVVELVQFKVAGASVADELPFLKVTTTTNVFADDETVRFVVSRRLVLVLLKVEAVVNSLSTRAICAPTGAANRSKARPQSSGTMMRAERGMEVFMTIDFMVLICSQFSAIADHGSFGNEWISSKFWHKDSTSLTCGLKKPSPTN